MGGSSCCEFLTCFYLPLLSEGRHAEPRRHGGAQVGLFFLAKPEEFDTFPENHGGHQEIGSLEGCCVRYARPRVWLAAVRLERCSFPGAVRRKAQVRKRSRGASRGSLLGAITLAVLTGCAAEGVIVGGPPPPPPPAASPHIPPGHMPPPGKCRIWFPDRPPGHQPPPGECWQLERQVPPGAWLIRG